MEQPRHEALIQRVLAVLLACAVAAVAALQRRSPLDQAIEAGRPWRAWLVLAGGQENDRPSLHLAIYRPEQRVLNLVYVPKIPRPTADLLAALPESADWSGLPLLDAKINAPAASQEPAARAKIWLAGQRWSRPGPWLGLSPFDGLLLFLELARLEPSSIHPAWLPEDARQRADLLHLLLGQTPPTSRGERAITAEIFNASGKAGLASQAKKVLRLQGVDVVVAGNSDAPEGRTLVYDRTGRHEDAETVRRMLGCRSALAVTRIDPKRMVDVSVMLADDCPLQ